MKLRLFFRYTLRYALIAGVAGLALSAAFLLLTRLVLLPQLERHPQKVAELLGRQIGRPVTVGTIRGGWSGWNPWITVYDLRIFDAEQPLPRGSVPAIGAAQVTLPEVAMQIGSGSSVLHLEPRFTSLRIERPTLLVRRDDDGRLFVGGALIAAASGDDKRNESTLADWLLRQNRIDINDGTVEWRDGSKPPLIAEHFQLRGQQDLGQYRIGLRGDFRAVVDMDSAAAPEEAAGDAAISTISEASAPGAAVSRLTGASFELRGSAARSLLSNTLERDWQFYVKFDNIDFEQLRRRTVLPIDVERGRGNVQAWATVSQREIKELTVDLALRDIKIHLAPQRPEIAPLELAEGRGRLGARDERTQWVFSTQGLSFTTKSGVVLEPLNATAKFGGFPSLTAPLQETRFGEAPSVDVAFNQVNLAALADLAHHVPLPDDWRGGLAQLGVHGTVKNAAFGWQRGDGQEGGGQAEPLHYRGEADFAAIEISPHEGYPGIQGLSGHIAFDEAKGQATLDAEQLTLDMPEIFAEALAFDRLKGNVGWTLPAEGLRVQIDALQFANADLEGQLDGNWQADRNSVAGHADLKAQLSRAAANRAYRYLPRVAGEDVRHWLRDSLKGGHVDRAQMVLKGELAHFPFDDGKHGTFLVEAHAVDVQMVYDPEWPGIDHLDADLRFAGDSMTVNARRGTIFDATLGATRATIPRLGADHPHLLVEGSARGATATYLRFLEKSPVGGWLDHMLDGAQAAGDGQLTLKLDIPLSGGEESKVSGNYRLLDNTIGIPDVPPLTHAQGTVSFTENDVRADGMKFEALGGSGEMELRTADGGGLALNAKGTADAAALAAQFALPFGDRISGKTDWQLALTAANKQHPASWTVTSSLSGLAVDLPAPLGKQAVAATPLRIAYSGMTQDPASELWTVAYQSPGAALQAAARRTQRNGAWALERLQLSVDKDAAKPVSLPPSPGVWVRGDLPAFNFDPWFALYKSLPQGSGAALFTDALPLGGIALDAQTLGLMGRQFHQAHIEVRPVAKTMRIDIASREAEGRVEWEEAASSSTPNGRLKGVFSKFTFPEAGELSAWNEAKSGALDGASQTRTATTLPSGMANPWPTIDFAVEKLLYKDRELGRWTLKAAPQGSDWRIESMTLANGEGRITTDGWWRTSGAKQRTEINVSVQVDDAEKFLERFGVPESVVASDAKLDGMLSWADAPNDFDVKTLSGDLALSVGKGRFTRIEPGIGRLLGVLSLQALPRRITLDFRDVFSEGFAFDSIVGNTTVTDGILRTGNLQMNGPAAKVKLTGEVDLSRETQNLDVRVQPSLTDSVSMGAAGASVLLMANPIGAAAVGIGALVGQMALGNPVEKIFSYEYTVKGSWDDPIVEKKSRGNGQAPATDAASPSPPPESKPNP